VLTGDPGFAVGQQLDIALQDGLGGKGDPAVTLGEGGFGPLGHSHDGFTEGFAGWALRQGARGEVVPAEFDNFVAAIDVMVWCW
jgi:hypothetical protein